MMAATCRGRRPMVPCGMGATVNDYLTGNVDISGNPVNSTSSTSWWQNLIGGAAGTAEKILVAKNQTKGIYTQTGPGGTVTYVQPEGSQANIFGATSAGITGTASPGVGVVLIGGAALLLVFMLAKGR